jgi:hypothetical protein
VDLDVALESDLGRQRGCVESLDPRKLPASLGDLVLDRLAGAIGQSMVLGVDAQERRSVGVGDDRAPEVLLDEVVEPLIEGTLGRGRCRAAERERLQVQGQAPTGRPVRPAISWRTSRVAWMIVVTSSALTS